MYLWCRTAPGISTTALLDRALASGVAFVAGPPFYPDPAGDSELRICFSSVLPAAIDDAVARLAASITAARREVRPAAASARQPQAAASGGGVA